MASQALASQGSSTRTKPIGGCISDYAPDLDLSLLVNSSAMPRREEHGSFPGKQTSNGKRASIKLIRCGNSDFKCPTHREIEKVIKCEDLFRGKHGTCLGYELRLLYKNQLRQGWFSINTVLFDHLYSGHARKKFVKMLEAISSVEWNYSVGQSSKRRVFKFPLSKKAPTYTSVDGWESSQDCVGRNGGHCIIPGSWLACRNEKWSEYCRTHNLPQHVDIDDDTVWGAAHLETLRRTTLPIELPAGSSRAARERVKRLTEYGVPLKVTRRHGRVYHPMSNLERNLRSAAQFDGEITVELDIHACYWCILASMLPNNGTLLQALQSKSFYKGFEESYWTYRAAKETTKPLKVEVQRQCLFFRDQRTKERPLWGFMHKQYPDLARLIVKLRKRNGISGLSHILQRKEGQLMVDNVTEAVFQAGCPVLCYHDGIQVRASDLETAREIFHQESLAHLGFTPSIAIKCGSTAINAD